MTHKRVLFIAPTRTHDMLDLKVFASRFIITQTLDELFQFLPVSLSLIFCTTLDDHDDGGNDKREKHGRSESQLSDITTSNHAFACEYIDHCKANLNREAAAH